MKIKIPVFTSILINSNWNCFCLFKYSPHQYSLFSFLEFLRMAALTKSSLAETKWCSHKQIFKDITPKNDFDINILPEVWWKISKNYLKNSCASAKWLFIKFHQKKSRKIVKFWKLKEDWKLWSSQQTFITNVYQNVKSSYS